LAILGLLLAILLPAVFRARASAQKVACANNLRQLSLSIAAFEEQYQCYPRAYCGLVNLPPDPMRRWCVSPLVQLSPFLEQQAVFDELSRQRSLHTWDLHANHTPAPHFAQCPADGFAQGPATSYRFCRGVLPLWPDDPGGTFKTYRPVAAREILDGLTHTAFVSERLVGTGSFKDFRRDPLALPTGLDAHDIAPACVAANQQGGPWRHATGVILGDDWASGDWSDSVYYHLLPPNSVWRDCAADGLIGFSLVSARSRHAGGVHVAFGDGHGDFIADMVDLRVWRASATRAGNDG
jgi:prepilin-type processing-associated H-X9-DG protein